MKTLAHTMGFLRCMEFTVKKAEKIGRKWAGLEVGPGELGAGGAGNQDFRRSDMRSMRWKALAMRHEK